MAGAVPPQGAALMLRGELMEAGRVAVMGIVNRNADSFYAPARALELGHVIELAAQAANDGADIIDVGAIRAGRGQEVTVAQELDRLLPVVAGIREQLPGVFVSVDTWRGEVASEVIAAGADLINDTWGGADP